ncbi:MAG: circumsporozoite protein- membrane associated protein, partial [Rubripirellula sp.]|nr:circumsporozoite protein- membrane associated protein [Rubripirellula sp.]
MSTAAPVRPETSRSKPAAAVNRTDHLIEQRITEACRALWWAEMVRNCLRLVLGAMAWTLVWLVVDQWIYSPGIGLRVVVWIAAVAFACWYVWGRILPLLRSRIHPEYAARSLERDLPELRQSLTSYVTLREQPVAAGLRSRVVRSIGAATAGRLKTYDELPTEATGTLRWWIAAAGGFAVLVAYTAISPKSSIQSAARLAAPFAAIDAPRRVSIRDVLPGDTDAIAGRVVAVSAVIKGLNASETPVCRWRLPSEDREAAMRWDETDRRFHGEIDLPYSVSGNVPYTISGGDAEVGPFYLKVEDLPALALQSVRYTPPAYTAQKPHATSSGAITALDGTEVTITATTNRPIAKAKIEFNPRLLGDRMQATAGATEMTVDAGGTTLTVSFVLRSAHGRSAAVEPDSYRIQVSDQAGQTNPEPIVYPIRVIADLPPEVSITLPFQSPTEVAIDAQQIIEVHASDPDFGLKSVGLEIRSGIDTIATPVLWEDPRGGKGNQVVEFAFRPSRYQLRIGDEVQVVAVAVDNRVIEGDPTVEPNITRTDPIVLKIAAGDPNRPQEEMQDDRDRQNKDANQDRNQGSQDQSSQGGQEGEPQAGQGGGGSDQDAGGQAQSEQPGEGSSGQGEGAQNEGSQEGDSSSEGSGGGSDNNSDSGDENQDPSGSGSQDGAGSESGSGSEGASGSQGGDGQPQSNDDQAAENQSGEDTADSNDTASSDAEGGKPAGSNGGQGSNGGAGQQQPADAAGDNTQGGADNEAQPSGESQAGDGQAGGASEGNGAGQGGEQSKQAPQHDGEAFERIRDYLEKQRKEQSQNGESQSGESQSGESQSGDSHSGDSQSGHS